MSRTSLRVSSQSSRTLTSIQILVCRRETIKQRPKIEDSRSSFPFRVVRKGDQALETCKLPLKSRKGWWENRESRLLIGERTGETSFPWVFDQKTEGPKLDQIEKRPSAEVPPFGRLFRRTSNCKESAGFKRKGQRSRTFKLVQSGTRFF
jgi:hypothetical protein